MIEKLIKKTARQLDRQKIPYMIIGGQAVLVYGRPRLTRDIDITLGLRPENVSDILEIAENLGCKVLVESPVKFFTETSYEHFD